MTTNFNLHGKTVLVTGASRGIGAATAHVLAAQGAYVIVHYGHDRVAATAVLAAIGGQGSLVQADLSDPNGASHLWKAAERATGQIHALVNNAGLLLEARVEEDLATWQQTWYRALQINLLAPADLCRFAIEHFRQHGGGKIVNIASRAAHRGEAPHYMPYGAAKAALLNLTKSIGRGFAHEEITAVAIAPGFVHTEMAQEYIDKYGKEAAVSDIPLGEMVAPSEVADLIAFVLQPGQSSLNGATLDINGGSYVR
ncbi:SDR family NAD(P)-dependent oxidoreductase [Ktedonospora formicarum]|uniref:Epimerase n=1 Tax=Ktedonospora formicarum TaxID=2778364 RepID=A0A8J3MX55_9CHLR|nr:SDR family NAD(P)-dependent oxidoreductase [Ktedonospora formicarum]GHO51085.1 epimerase [Ktedonospora formicarum]